MSRFRLKFRWIVLALIGVSLAAAWFLWASTSLHGGGYPLDDAWIHQTYARNLATRGEWAFLPGELSAGSTSPLWTLLLSLGYLASLPPLGYTYTLGILILFLIVILIAGHLRSRLTIHPFILSSLILMIAFEWHLVWAALSGMETLLLGLHIVLILIGLDRRWDPLVLGMIAGAGLWIRPDALLSLLPIAWVLLIHHSNLEKTALDGLRYLGGFLLLAFPYLLMNYLIGGEWWPSTYYAKQVEYASVRSEGLLTSLLKMGAAPLIGAGFLLVPGVVVHLWQVIQERNWAQLAGVIWICAFVSAYAFRLPVNYQHGRYMIPVIPALFLLGYQGLVMALRRGEVFAPIRILSRAWLLSLLLVVLAFWLKGANAYTIDVGVIQSEMVATSRWIEGNTDPGARIAAHDIGALGYFGDRRIIDLAGLITPEIIPIMRDEQALEQYLFKAGADYLMTFPGWYPELTRDRAILYSTGGSISPSVGGENMTVYRWP